MKTKWLLYIFLLIFTACSPSLTDNKVEYSYSDSVILEFDSRYFSYDKPTTFIVGNISTDTLYFLCKPILFNEGTHSNYHLEHNDTIRSIKNKGWTNHGWSSSNEFDTVLVPPQQTFSFASGGYMWAFDSIKVSFSYYRKTVSESYIQYTKSEYFFLDSIKKVYIKCEPFKVPKEMGQYKNPDTN
jgi:hypothetical protein